MQLQGTVVAFVVCVSLIAAGRHSHRGECKGGYAEDEELDAIPAGGYEVEDPYEKSYDKSYDSNSASSEIHHERQHHHSSLFQQDTPFLKTGIKDIRKQYPSKNDILYDDDQNQNEVLPYKEDKAHKTSENDVTNSKWSSNYSNLWHYLLKRKKPWLLLPNHGSCYQEFCESSKDCCRLYNICDKSAHVCIDCWYGYPCNTSADCCERYPKCHRSYGAPQGRCTQPSA